MKVVLITGAGSGIGLGAARAFAARGYRVYAGLRNAKKIPAGLDHPGITPLPLDITHAADIDRCAELIENAGQGLSHLINNAGVNIPGTLEEYDPRRWRDIFDINCHGPLDLTRRLLPLMRRQGQGRILMMSSLSAELGLPLDGAYAASKAALSRASESLAYEVAAFGISVTVVIPGAVRTGLNVKYLTEIPHREEAYRPLYEASVLGSSGITAEDLTAELLALAEQDRPPLFYPAGAQARDITAQIRAADDAGRARIVRNASGLGWWIDGATAPAPE